MYGGVNVVLGFTDPSCSEGPCLWALYYKFEQQHGAEEQVAAVVRRCVAAEPRHGELWCRVRKAVKNWHDEVDVLLTKAIAEMAME